MPIKAPKIDDRTYDDIVDETAELAEKFTDGLWSRPPDGKADAGMALIRIFARMAGLVIDRLNQVPEKNFLAFLDLIGMQLRPPEPARVPLTFLPAAGTTEDTLIRVPAGTQAAAPPPEGEEEEVIFETDQDLVLTTAKLTSVFVREPEKDRYADYTQQVTGGVDESFPAFSGKIPIEHSLYLAHDGIFTLVGLKTVTIKFETSHADKLQPLDPEWSYWNGNKWETLPVVSSSDHTHWEVTMGKPPVPSMLMINGKEHAWLRARLKNPLLTSDDLPHIKKITIDFTVEPGALALDAAFANSVSLDLSKDFFPFGEKPRFNDTLYLAGKEVFGNTGATVTMTVTLSDPPEVKHSEDLEIVWEASGGASWIEIGRSTPKEPGAEDFRDESKAFTETNKKVTFTLPQKMSPSEVNGTTNFWIRARIVKGNYGKDPIYKTTVTGTSPNLEYKTTIEGGFNPPQVASIKLDFQQKDVSLTSCLTCNDFIYEDHALEPTKDDCNPFVPIKEDRPCLYLGFDQPFANRPISIYAHVEPVSFDEPEKISAREAVFRRDPARVSWEYSNGQGEWARLSVEDETHGLAEPGLITFVGPVDFSKRVDFGLDHESYWIRARWERGEFLTPPRLRRLLTNTTWASQATTVQNETLGSSNGQPNQIFHTTKAPVLLGLRIEVREQEMPSAIKRRDTESKPAEETPSPEPGFSLASYEHWVPWHLVPNFHGSSPGDRHYVIDYQTGEVHFGDGKRGMVPPQGRGNIRAASYRTGGGTRGNQPAGAINQLKSAMAYVAGITNHYTATGGAEGQTLEHVKRFGPRTIRHRNRAVTRQDVEDLAYGASTDVARARAIAPHYDPLNNQWLNPDEKVSSEVDKWIGENKKEKYDELCKSEAGKIELIIVPRTDDPQPKPSLGLINHVREYVLARCSPTVDVQIRGADWVEVTVTATVVAVSAQVTINLEQTVVDALRRFLQPIFGGFDDRGWPFGRKPHDSDLYALIESIDGVDYVRELRVEKNPKIEGLKSKQLDRFLVYSGSHDISVVYPGEGA